MSEHNSRRRGAEANRPPRRVEDAAEAMMARGASGQRRGYIPFQGSGRPGDAQAWNGQMSGQGTGPWPGAGSPGGMQNTYPGNGWQNTNPGSGWQNTGVQNAWQTAQNTGSLMNPGQRGYTLPPSGGGNAPRKPEKKKGRTILAVLAAVVLVAALAAGGVFAAKSYEKTKRINDKVQPYDGLFVPGVYVDGIALGGMTPEQGMNSVQSQIRQRNDAWQVQLTYGGQVAATINAAMLGMNVDAAEVMNEAWAQGHTGTYEERYDEMLRLEEEPYYAYTAKPNGNNAVIDQVLTQLKSQIDAPAVNAEVVRFDTTQPNNPFIYTDEVYGRSLNIEPLLEKLYQMVSSMQSGTLELVPDVVEPAVHKADLEMHYARRASATTPISKDSSENRTNNIRRAFEFINGYKLDPGKTFSFNNVVGERTLQNGFLTAIEYAYGEHVMGVGGGVCQASTTVYQAAVCAGMQILKREPHSDSVSYTDYGKDATVSWVGKRKVDFSFKNTTDEPIYITAGVETDPSNKRRLVARVTIYGAYMGDVHYELESEIVETIPPLLEPVYVKDTDGTYVTYTDQEKVVSKAKEGYIVQSWLVKYEGGKATGRTELYKDTYKPKAERIYVGVKTRGQ